MTASRGNLYAGLSTALPEEVIEVLAEGDGVRIERIVSTGQATAPGHWYDQDQREWVVVLRGRAELQFDDAVAPQPMAPGDWVQIPAHRRHRVSSTSPHEPTVWLAVFY